MRFYISVQSDLCFSCCFLFRESFLPQDHCVLSFCPKVLLLTVANARSFMFYGSTVGLHAGCFLDGMKLGSDLVLTVGNPLSLFIE